MYNRSWFFNKPKGNDQGFNNAKDKAEYIVLRVDNASHSNSDEITIRGMLSTCNLEGHHLMLTSEDRKTYRLTGNVAKEMMSRGDLFGKPVEVKGEFPASDRFSEGFVIGIGKPGIEFIPNKYTQIELNQYFPLIDLSGTLQRDVKTGAVILRTNDKNYQLEGKMACELKDAMGIKVNVTGKEDPRNYDPKNSGYSLLHLSSHNSKKITILGVVKYCDIEGNYLLLETDDHKQYRLSGKIAKELENRRDLLGKKIEVVGEKVPGEGYISIGQIGIKFKVEQYRNFFANMEKKEPRFSFNFGR